MILRRLRDTAWGTIFSMLVHLGILLLVGSWMQTSLVEPVRPLAVALWKESTPEPGSDLEPPVRAPIPEPPPDLPRPTIDTPPLSLPEPLPEPIDDLPPVLAAPDDPLPADTPRPPVEMETPEDGPTPMAEPEVPEPDPAIVVPPEPIRLAEEVPAPEPPEPGFPSEESDVPESLAWVIVPDPPPEIERPELADASEPLELEEDVPPLPVTGDIPVPSGGPRAAERSRVLAQQDEERARSASARIGRMESQSERTGAPRERAEADTVRIIPGQAVTGAEQGVTGPLGERRLLYSEKPPYPEWARRMGLEAEARYRIWVDPDGVVNRVDVLQRSGNVELDELARDSLRRWLFEPLPPGDDDHDEWGLVPVSFTLVARAE